MFTTAEKRETPRVARLTTLLAVLTNRTVRSSAPSDPVPGRAGFSSWNSTRAPTSAGRTVPYRRTIPRRPEACTLSVTRAATRAVTTGLRIGRGSRVATRNWVLERIAGTRNAKRPVTLVVWISPRGVKAVRYGKGLSCSWIRRLPPLIPVKTPLTASGPPYGTRPESLANSNLSWVDVGVNERSRPNVVPWTLLATGG